MDAKINWSGEVISVQPRISLTRSFDERTHTYQGYTLRIRGLVDTEQREFAVGVGPATHAKHEFRVGDCVSGQAVPVADPETETVDFYKASAIQMLARGPDSPTTAPPFHGIPPSLEAYRQRGHLRLDARTYVAKCTTCLWGCEMAVDMIIDQWKPNLRRYRRETFCYGPKSCPLYNAGLTRKVPGRNGMSWEEEDWVDQEATAHREPHE